MTTTYLPTDFQKRPALDPAELLTDDEVAAILEREQAQADRRYGQKDFNEELHPRDDHGRFTDSGGGGSTPIAEKPGEQIKLPVTTPEIHAAYVSGMNDYLKVQAEHGGPGTTEGSTVQGIYQEMNVASASETPPDPEQLARCQEAAAKFLGDPAMQPLFDEYGRPEIVVGTGMVTTDTNPNGTFPGENPADASVVAQWSNGTIFLYAQTAGNPDVPVTPGFSVAGADPSLALIHEYGHQIMGVIGYDKSGDASNFRQSFVQALGDGIDPFSPMTADQQQAFQANVDMETNQVSEYASTSPDEAFAEFFTETRNPNFDINNYDGGAQEALQLIQDKISEDTKGNANQGTLFSRTQP